MMVKAKMMALLGGEARQMYSRRELSIEEAGAELLEEEELIDLPIYNEGKNIKNAFYGSAHLASSTDIIIRHV